MSIVSLPYPGIIGQDTSSRKKMEFVLNVVNDSTMTEYLIGPGQCKVGLLDGMLGCHLDDMTACVATPTCI